MIANDRTVANDPQPIPSLSPTVPCPPQSVESYLDCSTNTARVQWAAASGADSYEVQAYSAEGSVAGCSAEETECVLPDLVCGSIYNISVISVSNECNVSESDIIQLQTGDL